MGYLGQQLPRPVGRLCIKEAWGAGGGVVATHARSSVWNLFRVLSGEHELRGEAEEGCIGMNASQLRARLAPSSLPLKKQQ